MLADMIENADKQFTLDKENIKMAFNGLLMVENKDGLVSYEKRTKDECLQAILKIFDNAVIECENALQTSAKLEGVALQNLDGKISELVREYLD